MFHCQSTGCLEYHFVDALKKLEESLGKYPGKIWAEKQPPSDFNLTDEGNAERLSQRHGENIRYVHDEKEFRIWKGTHWAVDSDGEVFRLAVETIRGCFKAEFESPESETRTKKLQFFLRCENRNKLESMVARAKTLSSQSFGRNPCSGLAVTRTTPCFKSTSDHSQNVTSFLQFPLGRALRSFSFTRVIGSRRLLRSQV